jgi:serine/threonine protein kinase
MHDSAGHLPKLEPGTQFVGYRIEEMLDRGGMGVVYKASDLDLDRTVALKLIAPEHTGNPDAVARFKAEARLAASLEHPNIVPIHRGGEVDGVLYLAMRFVPGTNLRQLVDGGQLEMDRIQRVTSSVASALDAAHERGLVHRDVKPANILLSGEGAREHVYLTDFGLMKRLGSAGSLTRSGAWVGTPDYVAPEQIQGKSVDGRADVYSLGCVLYEMLTGSVAFPRDNDVAKLWAHVSDQPPSPSLTRPELVEAFDEAVARATAKDPDARYSTASELAAAVERAINEQISQLAPDALDVTREAAAPDAASIRKHEVFVAEPAPASAQRPAEQPVGEETTGGATVPPSSPPPTGGGPPSASEPGGAGLSNKRRLPVLAGLAVLLGAIAVGVALLAGGSDDGDSSNEAPGQRVPATLGPVPTNNVDGLGNATVRLNGNVAQVTLTTNGLLNGEPHAMHIHAGAKGACPTVEAAREHNGRLSMSTVDGAAFYGHPRVSLTTRGDIGVVSILEFARYPSTGKIEYTRTIRLRPRTVRFIRRNLAAIVVHGIDYNDNGRYDNTLGGSELNPGLSGEATAPALCGELVAGSQTAQTQSGVYAASLNLPGHTSGSPATGSWLCNLRLAT